MPSSSRRLVVCGALAAIVVSPGHALAQTAAPFVMKMGTSTVNDTQHEWMKRFAAAMEQKSAGRIKVEVYPASQLGLTPRMIEQTQFGTIQGFIGPAEFLSGVDIRYEVLGAPAIFKDSAHAVRAINDPAFNNEFLALGANKGLKGLGLFLSGPSTFATVRPVRKTADFKGMKIRVTASDLQMDQVRAVGGTPVPMALGEVMPALQQGALDGVMSNAPVFEAFRFHNVVKYQVITDQMVYVSNAVTSKVWFDRLPKDLQSVVEDVARAVSIEVNDFCLQQIKDGYVAWRKAGGEVIELDPAEQKALIELLRPIGPRVVEKRPDEKAMFESLVAAAARTQ